LWYAGLARLVLPDLSVFMLTQFNEGQAFSSLLLAYFSYVSPQRLENPSCDDKGLYPTADVNCLTFTQLSKSSRLWLNEN
ncbi:MAG TPA: hypothetical protein VJ761_02065, partial [Ktedonobacteraceae bacterium]|nr:hypothetical protein [Ktedonobacteraceae bacterium]